jgi:hypothetical protein
MAEVLRAGYQRVMQKRNTWIEVAPENAHQFAFWVGIPSSQFGREMSHVTIEGGHQRISYELYGLSLSNQAGVCSCLAGSTQDC